MPYALAPKTKAFVPYDPSEGTYRVRLDANESFLLPTREDRMKMAAAAGNVALNRYPDPLAEEVCVPFARLYGIKRELVTAGNGSDELISLIFSSFLQKGEKVLTLSPDFSMYRFYTSLAETPCVTLEKEKGFRIDPDRVLDTMRREAVRLLIFSNPCNPTSVGLGREEVRRIVRGTDALVVLDEAYMDFWDQSLLPEVEDYDNLIILKTVSKALGMAALRLGFAIAAPSLTAILRAAKSPYNVNAVTQVMASVVLNNTTYHDIYPRLLCQSREMLMEGMRRLQADGLIDWVCESCTNFVFLQVPDAGELYDEMRERGILVRLFGDDRLRITAGTESENQEVLETMRFLLQKNHDRTK